MGLRGWLRYSGALSCFPRPEMTYHAISFGTTVHVCYSEPTQHPASSITTACVILQVIHVHLSRRDTARSTFVRELNSTTSITWHTRIMPTLHTSKMITDRFAYHASTVYNNTAPSDTHLLWIMVFLVQLFLTFKFPSNVYECLPLHTATTNIQLFETFPDCKLWESWLGLHLECAENVSISYDITVLVCCLAT